MYSNRKKIIIGLIAGVALLVVVSVIGNLASTQELTINASDPEASIAIQSADGSNPRELGKGSVTARLAMGDYAIRATAGNKETRTLVTLGNTSKTVALTLAEVRQPQKLGTMAAHKPMASNTGVTYLNTGFGQLETYQLATRDNQPIMASMFNIADVFWANPNSAYLLDEEGVFSYFNGATASPINLSGAYEIAANAEGAVAASVNGKVEVRQGPDAALAYTLNPAAHEARLALGAKNRLLVYDTVVATEADVTRATPAVYEGNRKLDAASNTIKDLTVSGASWSPRASRLAISSQQGVYILDAATNKLTRLSVLSTPHAESFTWINEDTGLYFADQIIWRINVTTQTWEKLAHIHESVPTTNPFAVSPDGDNAYFITDVPEGGELTGGLHLLTLR